MPTPFDPFWLFRMPLSGNVSQPFFSPAVTVNYAGNAAVEEHVVADVASYGKQIGWLNELVLALANNKLPDQYTLKELTEAVKKIEDIKQQHAKSTLDGAIEALGRLQAERDDEYRHLLDARIQPLKTARA